MHYGRSPAKRIFQATRHWVIRTHCSPNSCFLTQSMRSVQLSSVPVFVYNVRTVIWRIFFIVKWILKKSWQKSRQFCLNFQSVSGENLKAMGSKIVLSVIVQCEFLKKWPCNLPTFWNLFTKDVWRMFTILVKPPSLCIRFLCSYKTKNCSFIFKAKEAFEPFGLVIS